MTHNPTPDEVREAGLLPCPFCGAAAHLIPQAVVKSIRFYVQCEHCDARTPSLRDEATARELWNTRLSSEQARPVAQSEGLVQSIALGAIDVFAEFLGYHKGGAKPTHEQKEKTVERLKASITAALSALPHTEAATRYGPKFAHLAPLVEAVERESIRGEAFEEAAKVAREMYADERGWHHFYKQAGANIATAIRALSPNPEPTNHDPHVDRMAARMGAKWVDRPPPAPK